jgi:acyl carrier protein
MESSPMTNEPVSQAAVAAAIKRYIADNFFFDIDADDKLDDRSNLFQAGVLDSYGLVELISFLEEQFAAKLQDEDMSSGRLVSVEGMAQLILERALP